MNKVTVVLSGVLLGFFGWAAGSLAVFFVLRALAITWHMEWAENGELALWVVSTVALPLSPFVGIFIVDLLVGGKYDD